MTNAAIDRYRGFFESLSPGDLDRLDEFYTPGVRFADPFSDVRGTEEIRRIFAAMFERAPDARFVIHEQAHADGTWFLYWEMTFTARGGRPWRIEGTSRIRLAEDGRVSEHLDYWDSGRQFYEHLPLLGALLRFIRRRMG